MATIRPPCAVYGVPADMPGLRKEATELRNHRIVAELTRPEQWKDLLALVRSRKIRAVVIQDLSTLGPTLAPMIQNLRDFGLWGCAVMTQDGPDLTMLDLASACAVFTRLLDYREHQNYLSSTRKDRDQGHAVGRPRFARIEQVRGGPEVAKLLRDGLSTRKAAARAGVSTNTVQRVRRMLERRGK